MSARKTVATFLWGAVPNAWFESPAKVLSSKTAHQYGMTERQIGAWYRLTLRYLA